MTKLSRIKPKIGRISTQRTSSPAVERLTGSTGVKVRARVLKRDGYLCQECWRNGRVRVADDVDHIVPLHVGGSNADGNMQSLCKFHHNLKSQEENKQRNNNDL